MPFGKLPDHHPERRNPERLVRLLVRLASVLILLVLLLATLGIFRVHREMIVRATEGNAVAIGRVVFELQGESFSGFRVDAETGLFLGERDFPLLDQYLRQFLKPFGIVKIKVYDLQRRILYSTDPTLVGIVDMGNSHLERALQGGTASVLKRKGAIQDLAREQRHDVDVVESYVPIRNEAGEVLGSFEIYTDVSRQMSAMPGMVARRVAILGGVLLLLSAIAYRIVRVAVDRLKSAQQALERFAVTDPLTGLFNRGEIIARARKELSRIRRVRGQTLDNSLSLVMIDIDHFKQINDTYGHLVGDEALREVSRRISTTLREYDVVGRYGGEEFLAILPGPPFEGALAAAQRIREFVRKEPVVVEGLSFPVTVSLGVATTRSDEEDFAVALRRADDGLLLAKQGGRDRVAWVDGPGVPPAPAG